jgi:Carboxypeptidase regulatory-like domain
MKTLRSTMAIALMLATSAAAQTGSSSVAGTVADSTNRVIPAASVTLANENSGDQRTAVANDLGEFVFPAVAPGTYTVKAQANGFRPIERRSVVVVSSSRLSVGTLQLEVGAVTETVQVTAQGTQVQTDSSEKSELVDLKELQNVSIRGRDPISFL